MGAGSSGGGFDPSALIASAFMPQTRSPATAGTGQATTPGYATPMSLFAPTMQPPKPPAMPAIPAGGAFGALMRPKYEVDDGRGS